MLVLIHEPSFVSGFASAQDDVQKRAEAAVEPRDFLLLRMCDRRGDVADPRNASPGFSCFTCNRSGKRAFLLAPNRLRARVLHSLLLIRLRIVRLWKVMVLISAVGTAIGWGWWHFDFLEMSDDERGAYDDGLKKFTNKWWFPWGQKPVSDDLVLVAVDEDTFVDVAAFPGWRDRYGSWPYDRIIWADVVDYLSEAGATLVVMDFTLSEPKADRTGDDKFGETVARVRVPTIIGFGTKQLAAPLKKVTAENRFHQAAPPPEPEPEVVPAEAPEPDPAPPPPKNLKGKKGKALKKKPAPAPPPPAEEFPGSADEFPTEADPLAEAKQLAEAAEQLRDRAAQAYAFPVIYRDVEATTFPTTTALQLADGGVPTGADVQHQADLVTAELPQRPLPVMAQLVDSAAGFGAVEPEFDDDGKMRMTHFAYSDGQNDYLTLSAAAAADFFGAQSVTVQPKTIFFGTHQVRIDDDGSARINYGGKMNDRFHTVSLSDVLRYRGATDPTLKAEGAKRFAGKVVFIGATAAGTGDDQKSTPFNSNEPGVVKQMATFDNIVHDRFITEAPMWASLLLAFSVALFSVTLVMVAQSVVTDIGAPVFLYFAFFVITGSFISVTNVHILSAMPGMAGTLAAVAATAFNRFFANKDRDFMRSAFSAYMEEGLVEQMVEGHKLPQLDGEELEVTAFFSDIKGFSTFSEVLKDEPKRLMALLNRYLSTVTPVVKAEGACIDKYIGDAVVALFGAPVSHPDHALRACRAALKVQIAVGELRKKFAEEGLPDVYTRIGLNTDKMLVGNIGSDDLLDYTALGDGMNLAARLEGTNKAYETLILIGPKTYDAVKTQMVCRELDTIRVAGKHNAIAVYELVGVAGQVHAHKRELLELYAKGLEQYRAQRFAEALITLKSAHDLDRFDGPTKVLAAKCNQFMQHPPPPGWDTVTQLEK